MFVFTSKPGSVKALSVNFFDQGGIQVQSVVQFDKPWTATVPVIISSMSIAQEVNVQYAHTLKRAIYVYIFGDQLGSITLEGVAFYRGCASDGQDQVYGIQSVLSYYESSKLSAEAKPVTVVLAGGTAVVGLLVGMSLQAADADSMMSRFTLAMKAIIIKTRP